MKVADIRVSFQLWARHPSDNTVLPLRVAESQLMMSDRQVDHGADATTSIRQARRARAHRRRDCGTLYESAQRCPPHRVADKNIKTVSKMEKSYMAENKRFLKDFLLTVSILVPVNYLLLYNDYISRLFGDNVIVLLLLSISTVVITFFIIKNKKYFSLSVSVLFFAVFLLTLIYYLSVKEVKPPEPGFIDFNDEIVFLLPIILIPHIIVSWLLFGLYCIRNCFISKKGMHN
jgi:hypothetical protein